MKVSDFNEQDSAVDVDESYPEKAAEAFVRSELPIYAERPRDVYVWDDDGVAHRFLVHVEQVYRLEVIEERWS